MANAIWKSCLGVLALLGLLCTPDRATAQVINNSIFVDCSGQYSSNTSIYSVLPFVTDGTRIVLLTSTPCNEGIQISGFRNIELAAWEPDTPLEYIDIQDSDSVYLYNLNVRHWGIHVTNSRNVTIDTCSSSNNSGAGLNITGASSVSVEVGSRFNFNAGDGIDVSVNSTLSLLGWGPGIEINSNAGRGLSIDRSTFQSLGNVSISGNNGSHGLEMLGSSTGLMLSQIGPHTISANPNGGIYVAENSQFSIGGNPDWSAPYLNTIQNNGAVGIAADTGGQVTLFGLTQVQDHSTAGVDVFGNSQANFILGVNQITSNGTGTEPQRAAIRLNENAHLFLRNAQIAQNGGPGVLEMMNSVADIAGSTFSSNVGGAVVCDGSSFVIGDLAFATLGSANSCKNSSVSALQHRINLKINPIDWKQQKAASDKVHAMIRKLRH